MCSGGKHPPDNMCSGGKHCLGLEGMQWSTDEPQLSEGETIPLPIGGDFM